MMTSRWTLAIGVVPLALAGASGGAPPGAAAREGMVARGDFEIVECLLPGQIRQLGSMTYPTPRRPVRTTTGDCRVRGGEYVAYDRADVKTALRYWLTTAEAGNAEAQNNVGEIYERGAGDAPNYEAAALWYDKAGKQGYSRALNNLGLLYEQGHGVPQDPLKALNFYRQAAGLPENSVVYEEAARHQSEELREQLTHTIAEKEAQVDALRKQVEQLEQKLRAQPRPAGAPPAQTSEIEALRGLVRQLESEKSHSEERLAAVARTRAPSTSPAMAPLDPQAAMRSLQGQNLGRFYALVIGNQDYRILEHLQTPRSDAAKVAAVLRNKYGFSVQLLDDSDDVGMLRALNDLDAVVRPEDNVLIYYAGHGWRMKAGIGETGYWLPVNADRPPNDTFWVPNEQITAHIGRLPARRVLVVADSCYAGLLSNDPATSLFGADGVVTAEYLKYKLPKRARLLIASGGDQPVLDVGGAGNSVFAKAFIDVLESNTAVLTAPALFVRMRDKVTAAAARNAFAQSPELKTIRSAGHEVGDFFFLPAGRT